MYQNLFAIPNECIDDPPLSRKKLGMPTKDHKHVKLPENRDKFAASGDSGSLIVVGKPGKHDYGESGLQRIYDNASAQQKRMIDEKYEKATLGLLVAADEKYAYGQRISVAPTALGATLYCQSVAQR
jgi:hypothetical protein